MPFILKAGKALNEQKTEVRIQYKDVTSGVFKNIPRNELVIRVQPNESVYIKMNSKLPGLSMQTVVTELDLTFKGTETIEVDLGERAFEIALARKMASGPPIAIRRHPLL